MMLSTVENNYYFYCSSQDHSTTKSSLLGTEDSTLHAHYVGRFDLSLHTVVIHGLSSITLRVRARHLLYDGLSDV